MTMNSPEIGMIKELVSQLKASQSRVNALEKHPLVHQLGYSDYQVVGQQPLTLRVIALREGVWNGIFYPAEEIKKSVPQIKGLPVRVEHAKDPTFKGNIVGQVTNALWDDFFQGAVAELQITDPTAAQMVLNKTFPAVSISTFLDYDEKGTGSDFQHLELSLVRRPACETCYIISHLSKDKCDLAACPCQDPSSNPRMPPLFINPSRIGHQQIPRTDMPLPPQTAPSPVIGQTVADPSRDPPQLPPPNIPGPLGPEPTAEGPGQTINPSANPPSTMPMPPVPEQAPTGMPAGMPSVVTVPVSFCPVCGQPLGPMHGKAPIGPGASPVPSPSPIPSPTPAPTQAPTSGPPAPPKQAGPSQFPQKPSISEGPPKPAGPSQGGPSQDQGPPKPKKPPVDPSASPESGMPVGLAEGKRRPEFTTDGTQADYDHRTGESGYVQKTPGEDPPKTNPTTVPSKKGPGGFWGDKGNQKLGIALSETTSESAYVNAYKSILTKTGMRTLPTHATEDPLVDEQAAMVGPQEHEIAVRDRKKYPSK